MFAVLGDRVAGARVLDLFAGSGALGFEAMSRGAASVVFVENDATAVMAIRRNAVRLIDDGARWRVVAKDVARALRELRGSFDIVLIDPPYSRDADEELKFIMQRSLLTNDGLVVVEHRSGATPLLPKSFYQTKQGKYGDTVVTFARARRSAEWAKVDVALDEDAMPPHEPEPPKRAGKRRRRS